MRSQILMLACALFLFASSPSDLLAAEMQYPLAIVGGDGGPVYVADRKLPGIWKISEGKAEIFYQGKKTFRTPLNAVRCLAFDADGQLLAGDSATRDVYRFTKDGDPQPLTKGRIGIPMSIAVNKAGEIFVADLETQRIWKLPKAGGEPKEFALMAGVRGLAFDSEERLIAVTNLSDPVRRLNAEGKAEVLIKGRPFQFPHHVAVDKDDTLFIADNYAGAIWRVASGNPPEKFLSGEPLKKPVGVYWTGKNLLIADPHAQQAFSVDADGKLTPLVKE